MSLVTFNFLVEAKEVLYKNYSYKSKKAKKYRKLISRQIDEDLVQDVKHKRKKIYMVALRYMYCMKKRIMSKKTATMIKATEDGICKIFGVKNSLLSSSLSIRNINKNHAKKVKLEDSVVKVYVTLLIKEQ